MYKRQALERSLTKHEERIEVLEKMVLRLYEDMVAGRISEANFNPVSYTHLDVYKRQLPTWARERISAWKRWFAFVKP